MQGNASPLGGVVGARLARARLARAHHCLVSDFNPCAIGSRVVKVIDDIIGDIRTRDMPALGQMLVEDDLIPSGSRPIGKPWRPDNGPVETAALYF